jgi:hypothetical protein
VDPFLERLILDCLEKQPDKRPPDASALLNALEEGWKGAAWTQREARAWWETSAVALLAARRAAERRVSRGPKMAVDVSSRMRSPSMPSTDSLPELKLVDEAIETALGRAPGKPSRDAG